MFEITKTPKKETKKDYFTDCEIIEGTLETIRFKYKNFLFKNSGKIDIISTSLSKNYEHETKHCFALLVTYKTYINE
jgi:hypothetical protein